MRRIIAAAVLVSAAMGGTAKAQLFGDWLKDNLRTGCAPMGLAVDLVGRAEGDDRLRDNLWNAAESRLRAAGIFERPAKVQEFSVSVLSTGPEGQTKPNVAAVGVRIYRNIRDTGLGRFGLVIVWERTALVGIASVRETVADFGDQFITEYLRANPECRR